MGESGERRIALAAIAGAHGVKGELRLKLFSESIDSLKRLSSVTIAGRSLTVASIRPGASPILRFKEISDRNAAEALRGELLTVARSTLPPLEDGEYYHADLLGLPCQNAAGEPLGRVVAVENFGAGDILEIEKTDGRRTMVPFRDGVADLIEGRIVVDPEFLA